MTICFDTKGNEKQKEVARLWHDDVHTDILYGGSKGSGKSYLGCSLIFMDAFAYPGTFYFIARKTAADIVRYTLPSIYEVFGHWGITKDAYKFNGQYNYFELYNGSRVYLVDAKYMPTDPMYERFGSMQMTRGWIEEAGEFTREAKSHLQASIGRWKNDDYHLQGKLLMTCNPTNNFLYTEYYQKWKANELPSWRAYVAALPTDNKMLPKGYIDGLLRTLSPSQISRLVHGNWDYDDDPTWLVDYAAVCDMFTNTFVKEGEPYISTDLAGKGRDKWVLCNWKGLTCRIPVVRGFAEGKEIEETLERTAGESGVPRSHIVSDSDGLGFFLESYVNGIVEFHGNARANDSDRYANLRSECYFKLAELVNKRKIHIICDDSTADLIKSEFAVLKSEDTNAAESKRKIISKDKMKELLGHSPDYLDALMMRMVFETKQKAEGIRTAPIVQRKR